MRRPPIPLLLCLLTAGEVAAHDGELTISPEAPPVAGDGTPWTSLEALDDAARFHFVVVTDRTGGHREGVFADGLRRVNLLQPAFVVSVGDLIEGYSEDRALIEGEWDEIDGMIETLDAPFFFVPGNHDYSNQVMADVWRERYGPDHYAFRYKDVLFFVLNSALFDREGVEGHGQRRGDWAEAQEAQLDWLERTLERHDDVRWTFGFMHRPYWRYGWKRPPEGEESPRSGPWPRHDTLPPEWGRVATLLEDRDYTFFAGHMHTYEYAAEITPHRHEHIALATTGGVSELRGPAYGEFDHFVWLTMTDDGPVIANLLLDGVLERDFEQPFQRPYWVPRDPADPLSEVPNEGPDERR